MTAIDPIRPDVPSEVKRQVSEYSSRFVQLRTDSALILSAIYVIRQRLFTSQIGRHEKSGLAELLAWRRGSVFDRWASQHASIMPD